MNSNAIVTILVALIILLSSVFAPVMLVDLTTDRAAGLRKSADQHDESENKI